MNSSPLLEALNQDAAREQSITHESIAARARDIWTEQGCPEGCDEAIWLEAEAEILSIRRLHQPEFGKDNRHA